MEEGEQKIKEVRHATMLTRVVRRIEKLLMYGRIRKNSCGLYKIYTAVQMLEDSYTRCEIYSDLDDGAT